MRIHPAVLTFAIFALSAAAQERMVGPVAPSLPSPKFDLCSWVTTMSSPTHRRE